MKLLCISGKRESGKSTLAKALIKHGWVRLSLAEPLKEMCKKKWGLNNEQVYGCLKESPTPYRRTDGSFYTPRDIMIREGCLARSIDPLFWCKKLVQSMTIEEKVVIDDVRFLNEIQYFKDFYPTKFVRLERSQEAIGKAALDDLSETELDTYKEWDFKLDAQDNLITNDLEVFAEILNANA